MTAVRLIDRGTEKRALTDVLDTVRLGMRGALVLSGEPGAGKSALLAHAVEQAEDMQVLSVAAVESEERLAFAGIHQLLLPILAGMDRLPDPQRRALGIAFGRLSGPPADLFLVGLAVLTLLSDAAKTRPVLCVVDDAHWLDAESADLLGFVARRLLADPVGLLFAVREEADADPRLPALPGLRVGGLPQPAAYELLEAAAGRPVDGSVARRIVSEADGNPLAVVEVARELTADQLSGRAPLPDPLPVGHRLERSLLRRMWALPADSQALLVLASAADPVRGSPFWTAAAELGIPETAAAPAEAAGLVTFSPEVRFAHSFVRTAVYQGASHTERRKAHQALAAACDPELDVVARAWHLASAAVRPDERVAVELEAAADRARSRGGYAATAALLERAATLTPNEERRAERKLSAAQAHVLRGTIDRADALLLEAGSDLRNPLSTARATQLRGRILAAGGREGEAVAALVDGAERLSRLDPPAARDALLSALESAAFAGWAPSSPLLQELARIADALPPSPGGAGSASDLLLAAYTTRVTRGYAAAVPGMQRAVQAFLADDLDPDVGLRRLELAAIGAADLLDDVMVERLAGRWIERAREGGALGRLAGGLAFRSAFVDAPSGRLAAAFAADAEVTELGAVTHNPAVVPPTGAHRVIALALGGREAEARATAAATARDAPGRGAAGEAALASYGLGLLELGLGNYEAAVACLEPACLDDSPLIGTQALPDLIEAAVRAGRRPLAETALERLADRATASGTSLALGLLARSEALLAEADEAGPKYEEALLLLGLTRAVPQLARAELLQGEWLRRLRRRREARDRLREALDVFDAVGFAAFAERTRIELRATGERVSGRESEPSEELTAQEAQIAALVSRGEANREIAAQLFVSPSTVEYHLRKVFRKVGVTSRTQLARHVMDRGMTVAEPRAAGTVRAEATHR